MKNLITKTEKNRTAVEEKMLNYFIEKKNGVVFECEKENADIEFDGMYFCLPVKNKISERSLSTVYINGEMWMLDRTFKEIKKIFIY